MYKTITQPKWQQQQKKCTSEALKSNWFLTSVLCDEWKTAEKKWENKRKKNEWQFEFKCTPYIQNRYIYEYTNFTLIFEFNVGICQSIFYFTFRCCVLYFISCMFFFRSRSLSSSVALQFCGLHLHHNILSKALWPFPLYSQMQIYIECQRFFFCYFRYKREQTSHFEWCNQQWKVEA